jgi:SAM-dependent methyltransferase
MELRRLFNRGSRALSAMIVPGLRNSQYAYRDRLRHLIHSESRWLDLGCGQTALPAWMPESVNIQRELIGRCRRAVGIDAVDRRPHLAGMEKHVGDVARLPFPDNEFTLVTANMVMEHVTDPVVALRETLRVLAPGGTFLFHTPNLDFPLVSAARSIPDAVKGGLVHYLDGRNEDDIFPTVYLINREQRIAQLASEAGFMVRSIDKVESTPYFTMFGPAVIAELLAIRIARCKPLQRFRPYLIIELQKPPVTIRIA